MTGFDQSTDRVGYLDSDSAHVDGIGGSSTLCIDELEVSVARRLTFWDKWVKRGEIDNPRGRSRLMMLLD